MVSHTWRTVDCDKVPYWQESFLSRKFTFPGIPKRACFSSRKGRATQKSPSGTGGLARSWLITWLMVERHHARLEDRRFFLKRSLSLRSGIIPSKLGDQEDYGNFQQPSRQNLSQSDDSSHVGIDNSRLLANFFSNPNFKKLPRLHPLSPIQAPVTDTHILRGILPPSVRKVKSTQVISHSAKVDAISSVSHVTWRKGTSPQTCQCRCGVVETYFQRLFHSRLDSWRGELSLFWGL